ncbi:MAG: dTDP-4-dehydrorhamnose reductase [Sphingomonadales bacterium]|nr:dTDP-4-dehydrorhamnose reductase [Sphingomonadales bacterium]
MLVECDRQVWLITGGSGQVGGALVASPPPGVRVIAPGRDRFDLGDPTLNLSSLLATEGITAIVNCGAYTKVDQAEDEEALALQVNGLTPGQLAHAARNADIPIVQISTDYVFSGERPGFYSEDDPTGPRSAYGRTKLAGEQAVIASGARYGILRTAWVFSAEGANFVRTMVRLCSERDTLGVVADQLGCPTHAGDLAQVVARITQALEGREVSSGIWHVVNGGEASWHDLAAHVIARTSMHGRRVPTLNRLTTAEYPTKAPRPANSRLATKKLRADFGIVLRDWQEAAAAVVDAIIAQEERFSA